MRNRKGPCAAPYRRRYQLHCARKIFSEDELFANRLLAPAAKKRPPSKAASAMLTPTSVVAGRRSVQIPRTMAIGLQAGFRPNPLVNTGKYSRKSCALRPIGRLLLRRESRSPCRRSFCGFELLGLPLELFGKLHELPSRRIIPRQPLCQPQTGLGFISEICRVHRAPRAYTAHCARRL